jgi:hypothetical protein
VTAIIRAVSVVCILRGPPSRWTQVAGKEKLGTSIPTLFQQNIIGIFLNAVRIRRDNKDGVLHTTKLDIKIQSKIKVYEHGIYIVYTKYVHVCNMYVHVLTEYVQIPVDSFHESGVLAYQMDNIWHA